MANDAGLFSKSELILLEQALIRVIGDMAKVCSNNIGNKPVVDALMARRKVFCKLHLKVKNVRTINHGQS